MGNTGIDVCITGNGSQQGCKLINRRMHREVKLCNSQSRYAGYEINEKEGERKMFNKKLKQENRMLRLDNSDLSNELIKVNDELKAVLADKWGLEFRVKHLENIIAAEGELLEAFSNYIINKVKPKKVKKIKTKKGAKHGKRNKEQ